MNKMKMYKCTNIQKQINKENTKYVADQQLLIVDDQWLVILHDQQMNNVKTFLIRNWQLENNVKTESEVVNLRTSFKGLR